MDTEFATIIGIQDLVERGRAQYPDIYNQWCAIGRKMADFRQDGKGHAYEHLDANVDLVLRALEAEQQKATGRFGDKIGGGVFFAQISLSKMWLFAVYEIVRQTCEHACAQGRALSDYCGDALCYRCNAVRPVRDRLNLFRIPLAKLQPERTQSAQNYHAELVIDVDNGSVGWRAMSGRSHTTEVTSRLALSDYVLGALR